ncbi:MAG: glutamine--fructose-6-phosphate transaminase (isomerizing) [Myxococcota bacterium]|nr:glutamine--fructose-6-phosphate transaminase (isomerizing) [Myxococcota bacterium]MDW8362284.1 glutamine--fructose-6-phosphate transaminase (isomerizing) [Myxococcales bacterium]
MCGIVGYVGSEPCARLLYEGLQRLEYRGYDSAGLAVHDGTEIHVLRAAGKIERLGRALAERPLPGTTGIGHTRWATHGRPNETNAHPHRVDGVALVHNGIIENHVELRRRLTAAGARIQSETDTELVAHLVAERMRGGLDLLAAVRAALAELRGAYALAVLARGEPGRIVVAKSGSPLVVGLAGDAAVCASDVPALLPWTRDVLALEDGEMAVLERASLRVYGPDGRAVDRPLRRIDWSPVMAEKAGFKHFMLKEIFEQPRAIEDTLRGRLDRAAGDVHGDEIGLDPALAQSVERVHLVACGTSHHAAMLGRWYIERLARVAANVELASEFRGRDPVVGPRDLVVAVSQSGETIDTLVAAREARERGAAVLGVVNVVDSAIARMADATFYTHAGPEIGVASTKCFTTQIVALLLFAIWLGRRRGTLPAARAAELVEGLARLPAQVHETLRATRQLVANLARRHADARDVLFLGRGPSYPVALEGALKLKEISYVHAEGYAAGEMKHGPIALVDASVPVFVVAPRDASYERVMSNLEEARARDGRVVAIVTEGDEAAARRCEAVVEVPACAEELSPVLTVLPLQLFAYFVADHKGTDVDQPRNLAKTVTVE